jgi:hypothetical protein
MAVIFTIKDSNLVDLIDYVCQAIFSFDIIINLFTSFYRENYTVENNIYVVMMVYFKSWFMVDLIAFIPF